MNSGRKILVGFDIGGTKIEIIVLSEERKVLFQSRLPTDRHLGYEHILSVIKNLFDLGLDHLKISGKDVSSIGLALPGAVDPKTQRMIKGNTRVLEGKDLAGDVLKNLKISIPIYVENDANCFALAEHFYGAGKNLKSKNMIGVILGTGLGGGIVINGKVYSGSRGTAGEIGHTFFKATGKVCYCGQKDCVELYLSGTGVQEEYFKDTQERLSTSQIFKNEKYLESYKEDLAFFLGKLTNILDPDYFVLGGGVSKPDALYEGLEELMQPYLFHKENAPKVYKHQISDSAGSIGAALLGLFDL